MLRDDGQGREIRFSDGAVRGNLRLVVGMIRANRPWALIIRMSRALAAALGGAAFALVSPGVWQVAAGAGPARMIGLAAGSVLATGASVIVAHGLWERAPGPAARERVALLNLSVALTTALGVLMLYLTLLVITTACGSLLISPAVLSSQIGQSVHASDYVWLGWLVSSLATIGGALGAVVESDLSVREAVYGYRADAEDET
jgi:hypothetical protein